jgi:hypothetical protein
MHIIWLFGTWNENVFMIHYVVKDEWCGCPSAAA